jgi:hypothetical protein
LGLNLSAVDIFRPVVIKRFSLKLAPFVLALIAAPALPAAPRHLSVPVESPETGSMLVAGAALMAFGLMGRKRRAEKAPGPH